MKSVFLIFLSAFCFLLRSQSDVVVLNGYVNNEKNKEALADVSVIELTGQSGAITSKKGFFELKIKRQAAVQLFFSHLNFNAFTKEIRTNGKDTVTVTIFLKEKNNVLNPVEVFANRKPETLVGKPNYSVFDFDFYEDKLILLTAERSLSKAQLRFAEYDGKIIATLPLPKDAGTAGSFFHDYEGYTDIVCSDTIFRLDILNNDFLLMPIGKKEFEKGIKPVLDTASTSLYYSDQWEKYPLFNYYFLKGNDTSNNHLATVCNTDLMKLYNMEYYYLKPSQQLEARRIAMKYKIDKRVVAALMSGFTQSMYYEPIYAPLFVMRDTVCVFNHYSDHIYHFDKGNELIDSVKINYHHPANWREWKKQLYVDRPENKVYAFFSKDGHHYLKHIDHQTGKEVKTYKLKHHSAEKIKIKEGYVYYVYRPFGSTQEKFLYRERIE